MSKPKIRKGDKVIVTNGKDRGTKGEVIEVLPKVGKVVIQGVAIRTIHKKPQTKSDKGEIKRTEHPIDISNVAILDPKKDKPTRLRIERRDGKRVRVAIKSNTEI